MKTMQTRAWGWVVVLAIALTTSSAWAGKGPGKLEVSGVVNLNTATAAQLDLLPGIGEKAAKRIIEHRTKTPFAKVEDLRRVKGFGAKKLEKLKPYLTITGPTTATTRRVSADAASSTPVVTPSSGTTAPPAQGRKSKR